MIFLKNHDYNYAKAENNYACPGKEERDTCKYPSQYLEELSGLSELVAFSNILSVQISLSVMK